MSTKNQRFSASGNSPLTPFWHRLPRFFLYPAQLGPLLRMGIYSGLGAFALAFMPLVGVLAWLMLWSAFLKYAFLVVEHTARGHFEAPEGPIEDQTRHHAASVGKQFVLLLLGGLAAGGLAVPFGPVGLAVGILLTSLTLPAGVMTLAVNGSLLQALHPGRIFSLIKTIGSPYLALYFFLVSLTGSSAWLQEFLGGHLALWLRLPILSFVAMYFTLIMYHMMGYALHQYHDVLGLKVAVGFAEAEASQPGKKPVDPVLLKLSPLMAEGRQEEAIDLLENALRTRWEDNDLHERYHKLLMAAGKRDGALRHGRQYLNKLMSDKRLGRALDLCEQCLGLDPEFRPQDPAHTYELARAASQSHRAKLALSLLRGFDKRNPRHPQVPAALLLYAQVLSEPFHKDKEALLLLKALLARFPDHELAGEARQYQAVLEKMAGERRVGRGAPS